MSTNERLELIKTAIVVVPVFAGSIAACYDVGFFYGLDISYFTFFSFTEHMVFALQAIPFALPPAISIIGFLAVSWWGYHNWIEENAAFDQKLKAIAPDELKTLTESLHRKVRFYKIADPVVRGLFIAFVLLLLLRHNYSGAFLIVVSLIVVSLQYPVERMKHRLVRVILVTLAIMTPWIAGFLLGYERSSELFQSNAPSETITVAGNDIPAKLIRGGDRGILFMVFDTKKLNFLRWDAVQKIQSL
jgi:hypothetical protein